MQYKNRLSPVVRCRSIADYEAFIASDLAENCLLHDNALIDLHCHEESWTTGGKSLLAGTEVDYIVDQLSGGCKVDDKWKPNLRERLVCPITGLNNRQRLVCSLVADKAFVGAQIWLMEHVTPVFAWTRDALPNCEVIGSEFHGDNVAPGEVIDGIRHEDVEQLSFPNASLDLVVSNEVLEHVPHPSRAFSECARVLRQGGRFVLTIPFCAGAHQSIVRAETDWIGQTNYLLEKVYHGNPMSDEGSLVYTDFGWDVLDTIKQAGFRDAWIDLYHSPEFGHYGSNLIVFECVK